MRYSKLIISVIIVLIQSGCASSLDYDRLTDTEYLVFQETFEKGTLKNIKLESPNHNSFKIMEDFKDKNNHMLKVLLRQGDYVNNGNRAEFKKDVGEKIDDEILYKVDFMVDKQYIDSSEWQSIFQLHDKPDFNNGESWETYQNTSLVPPLMIDYINNELKIKMNSDKIKNEKTTRIEKDVWYTLAVHVKYSYDGYVNVFLDGKSISSGRNYYSTIYNDSVNYVKIGLYRDNKIESNGVIYFDNFEIYRIE
uniref:Polysacc_lyase domain-containing protein n=1 Tax=Erysipelothrix sp. 715 TaxID=2711235 RepID=A0A6S6I2U8_9FIRM|nr:Polysacc_lyase domain-containing protein [Erysipelothrix sp. 715]